MIDSAPPPDSSPSPDGGVDPARTPSAHRVVLELSRPDTAPQLSRYPKTRYRRRWAGGRTREAELAWSEAVQGQLAALAGVPFDPRAAADLGAALRGLLDDLDIDADEKAILPGQNLQFVFRFDARELLALPWELAPFEGAHGAPIGRREGLSIQYEMPGTATRLPAAPPDEGGPVLLAWNGDVPAAEHRAAIEEACAAAGVPVTLLPDASLPRLLAEIERARPAVLHLLCHGEPLPGKPTDRAPATGNDRPATANDRAPATANDRPATANDRPPATANDRPATGNDRPLTITSDRTATGNDRPLTTTSDRTATGNDRPPSTATDRPTTASDRALATGNDRAPAPAAGDAPSYGLRLRDEDGPGDRVVASSELRAVLEPHAADLRLVVVHACWGGAAGALSTALGSVAEELHALGIQSVIASRFALSKPGSVTFTRALYRALLVDGSSLQDAVAAARRELAVRHTDTHDWAAHQLFARVRDGDLRPFVFRPYRGLLSFDEAHARFYCAPRHELREATDDALRLLSDPARPRLLVVTGASGRGKSSFAAAGLVPALKRLLPGVPPGAGAAARRLRPSEGLAALEEAVAGLPAGEPSILLVDQLEEVFTTLPPPEQRPYVAALWSAATDRAKAILVLATLRVDHIARCGDFPLPGDTTLEHLLYDDAHHVFLGPLREEDRRRIIEAPARAAGLRLQDGLCDRILEDAGDEPGALPLIEYVLDELWKRRSNGELTLRAYEALSGVRGALEAQAEQALLSLDAAPGAPPRAPLPAAADDLASPSDGPERRLAKRLLVRLVATSDGAAQATRRVGKLSELRALFAGEEDRLARVLDALADKRLIVLRAEGGPGAGGDTFVEIAHEALIRDWKKLRQWVEASRLARRDLDHFERLAASSATILRGEELSRLERLLAASGREASAAVHGLCARSREEEERRRRAETRHRRRVIAVAVVASLWAAATSVLVVLAVRAAGRARESEAKEKDSAARARRESLVSGARALLARKQPVWAAKLLLAVDRPGEASGWVDVAVQVLERRLPHRTFRGAHAVLSADGALVAAADTSTPTAAVEPAGGDGPPLRLEGHAGDITGLAFSPDGARLATASEDGTMRVWSARDPRRFVVLESGSGPIRQPVFSLDGRLLAAVSGGRGLLFRPEGGPPAAIEPGDGEEVSSVRPSPDGRHVLVRARHGRAEVWTLDPAIACEDGGEGARPCRVAVLADHTKSADFSPDGWRAFTSDVDRTVLATVVLPDEEEGEDDGGAVYLEIRPSVATWPAGAWAAPAARIDLAGAERDRAEPFGRVEWVDGALWLLTGPRRAALRRSDGETIKRLPGHDPVAVSRDGLRIAVTGPEGVSVTSTAAAARRVELWGGAAEPRDVRVHGDGSLVLASVDAENASRLFRAAPGGPGTALAHEDLGPDEAIEGLALGPGARHALVEWRHAGTFLWDVGGKGPAVRLPGRAARLSLDGRRALTLENGRAAVTDTHAPEGARWLPVDAEAGRCEVADARFDAAGEHVILICENGEVREASASEPGPSRLLGAPTDCVPDGGPVLADTGTAGLFYCSAADVRVLRIDGEIRLAPLCDDARVWTLTDDGETAVCGAGDGIIVFTLDTPDRAAVAAGWGAPVTALGASRDSRRLWALTADNTVRVIDLESPGTPLLVARHPQSVASVAFDARADALVTSSWDGWVRVHRLSGHGDPVLIPARAPAGGAVPRAVLSGDGQRALVASADGALRFHDLSIDALTAGLAANVDCLPAELRRLYLGEAPLAAEASFAACEREHGR